MLEGNANSVINALSIWNKFQTFVLHFYLVFVNNPLIVYSIKCKLTCLQPGLGQYNCINKPKYDFFRYRDRNIHNSIGPFHHYS